MYTPKKILCSKLHYDNGKIVIQYVRSMLDNEKVYRPMYTGMIKTIPVPCNIIRYADKYIGLYVTGNLLICNIYINDETSLRARARVGYWHG